ASNAAFSGVGPVTKRAVIATAIHPVQTARYFSGCTDPNNFLGKISFNLDPIRFLLQGFPELFLSFVASHLFCFRTSPMTNHHLLLAHSLRKQDV
ncbi:MAG TPA: hypothetical protein VIS99_13385, partial [Terrimicrobiaceae bacterium]